MSTASVDHRTVSRRWAFAAAVVVGLGLGGLVAAKILAPLLAPPRPALDVAAPIRTGPQPLRSVDQVIDRVSVKGQLLAVHMTIKDGWDADSYFVAPATAAEALGKAIKAGGYSDNLAGVRTVEIVVDGGVQDRLGHRSVKPFYSLTLPIADLRAAEYDHLQWADVLDLADTVIVYSEPGVAAAAQYCSAHPDYTPNFCAKARA